MLTPRDLVVRQIDDYVNYHHRSSNVLFSAQNKRKLLESITENFSKLSPEDKNYIEKYHNNLYLTNFSSKQKTVLQWLIMYMHGGIGGTLGWFAGSMIGNSQQNRYVNCMAQLVGWGIGLHQGVWMSAAAKYPDVNVHELKRKMLNMGDLTKVFNPNLEHENSLQRRQNKL